MLATALAVSLLHVAPTTPPGMVLIPAGTFVRGRSTGPSDQRPVHTVSVSSFFFDETLVTVAAFRRFVDETGHRTSAERLGFGKTALLGDNDWAWREVKGLSWRAPFGDALAMQDDHPVTLVSWLDADAYCRHLNKRLPTEAEWEYAMRAGAQGRFPWGGRVGDDFAHTRMNIWEGATHKENPARDGFVYVSPVRAFPPNAWGLFDAVGNVWQWTADWYARDAYEQAARAAIDGVVVAPRGPATGRFKVARGGSWWCSSGTCSGFGLIARGKTAPDAPFANNGFRCASDRVDNNDP